MQGNKLNDREEKLMRQHRFKNFVALFLVFVLVIGLMPIEDATVEVKAASQTQQNENEVVVSDWAGLRAALGRNGATIKLSNDIEAEPGDAGLVVTGSAITIDLNNHAINRNLTVATSAGFAFKVASCGALTLKNGTVTGGSIGEIGGVIVDGGKLTLDGTISIGSSAPQDSLVVKNNGKILIGSGFDLASAIHIHCNPGTQIFESNVTKLQAGCFTAHNSESKALVFDAYRNAFYLPNDVSITKNDGLVFNSNSQQLIAGSTVSGGTVYYQINAYEPELYTNGAIANGWTTDLSDISRTLAGTYKVWYAVVGDDNYTSLEPQSIEVVVGKADSRINTSLQAGTVHAETDETIQVSLPELPEGMSYKTPVVSGGVIALINTGVPMSITGDNANGHILTFAVKGKSYGTNATISVPVDGGENYRDTCLTVDVTVNTRINRTPSFRLAVVTKTFGDGTFINELQGNYIGVRYSSSGSAVTVDQYSGRVTINGCGTATVFATVPEDNNYNEATASYTVIVNKRKIGTSTLLVTGAENLQYDGNEHPLVTKSGSADGTVLYAVTDSDVDTAPTLESEWGIEIPKGKDAGKYKVWYKVVPNDQANNVESDAYSVVVTIGKASLPADVKELVENKQLIAQKEAEYYVFLNELPGEDMSYAEPSATADEKSLIKEGSLRLVNVVADGKNRTKLYFTTNKASKGAFAQISVKVKGGNNYSDGTAYVKATVGVNNDLNSTFAESSVQKNFGDASFTNTINNSHRNVIYSSNNTSVAEVNSNGLVTIKGVGTATITAKVNSITTGNPDDPDYNVKTIRYELTVSTGTPQITNIPTGYTDLRFAPKSNGSLVGNEQSLLRTGGSITGGTMYYAVTDASVATPPAIDFDNIDASVWSNQVPKRSDAGTYRVWYAVKGSTNYCNLEPTSDKHVDVTIATIDHPLNGQTKQAIPLSVNSGQGFNLIKADEYAVLDFKSCAITYDPSNLVRICKLKPEDAGPSNYTYLLIECYAKPYGTEATVSLTASVKNYNDVTFYIPLKVLDSKDRNYGFDQSTVQVVFENDKTFTQAVKGDVSGTKYKIVEDGSQVAKIDESTGEVLILKTGTITIKAYAEASEDHEFKAAEATYTLEIVEGTPEITKTPSAKQNLVYIEETAQQLVASGSAINGTMLYAVLDDVDAVPGASDFSEDIPEKTDAGKYAIWYMVKGNAGYCDIAPVKLITEIKPADYEITESYSVSVAIDELGGKIFDLSELPREVKYTNISVSCENPEFIDPKGTFIKPKNNTIKINTLKAPAGTTATLKITVDGGRNYVSKEVTISVKAEIKIDQPITAEETKITKTFGDDPFTNSISGTKTELTYAVKSGADVVAVDADGRITIKGSGEAVIGVTAASTDKYNNAYVEFVVVVNKADSEVVKAPEAAKNLTYNGKDQTLVSEGTAKGGDMLYAVTKKADETVAEDAFASELPAGKEAGTYFVWYMVKGDGNHNDLFVKDVVRVVIDVPYVPEPVSGGGSGGSGSAESSTETETTETEATEAGKTETEKESEQKEEKAESEPEVVTNEDGSTTTTTVDENEDGSVTTKEETVSADGSAVTKEETVMADGSVVAKEESKNADGSTVVKEEVKNADGSVVAKEEAVSSDGTVTTKEEKTDAKGNKETKEETVETDGTTTKREEKKNAKGEGTATVVKADADGNVLSETQETTSVNKKGSVTVKSVTENADGSTVERNVKTTKSGNVTATTVEKDADGSVTTTNETVKNYASGAVKTTSEKVEKDADGSVTTTNETVKSYASGVVKTTSERVETDAEGKVVATVEKTVKVAKADEEGNVKTTSTVKSTDATGKVTTTKETVVVDAKGQASVSSVTTGEDGSKVEKSFKVSGKGTVKMAALETTAKEVEIPKTVEVNGVECPVTTISKNAMKGNKNVTSVEIGENITTIGAGAFKNSKNLETIELTDSITKISANAFKGIAKNATFKIKASSQDEFDRIVALLKDSGVSDTVKFEMA